MFNHNYLSKGGKKRLSIKAKSLFVIQVYFHVKMKTSSRQYFPPTSPPSEEKMLLLYL